eukprot:3312852-Pleurochrysis_carterae.AAC.3
MKIGRLAQGELSGGARAARREEKRAERSGRKVLGERAGSSTTDGLEGGVSRADGGMAEGRRRQRSDGRTGTLVERRRSVGADKRDEWWKGVDATDRARGNERGGWKNAGKDNQSVAAEQRGRKIRRGNKVRIK